MSCVPRGSFGEPDSGVDGRRVAGRRRGNVRRSRLIDCSWPNFAKRCSDSFQPKAALRLNEFQAFAPLRIRPMHVMPTTAHNWPKADIFRGPPLGTRTCCQNGSEFARAQPKRNAPAPDFGAGALSSEILLLSSSVLANPRSDLATILASGGEGSEEWIARLLNAVIDDGIRGERHLHRVQGALVGLAGDVAME